MKKRYTIALLTCSLAAALSSDAQNPRWAWAQRDGNLAYSINPDYPRQVVAAASNRVLWGTIQNQRMLYNTMLGDYKVQELDTSGNQTAALRIDGKLSLLQAKADAAGNWYVLGTFYDSLKIGQTPLRRRGPGDADRFLIRLHTGTLALDWYVPVGGNVFCSTESFIVDGNAIYLSIDSALSSRIVRYELSDGTRSPRMTQNSRSYVTSLSRDEFGGTYVLGNCIQTFKFDFNGTEVDVPRDLDYPWYIVRYGPNGLYDWHHFMNDASCLNRALNPLRAGGIVLSGDLIDTASIGGQHLQKAQNEDNYVIARLDNSGAVSWTGQRPVTGVTQGRVHFGGPEKSLVTDSLLITAPESQGTCIWGTGGLQTNNDGMSGTVVAYSTSTGRARWVKNIDADFSNIQQIASGGGALYITGLATDMTSINFDSVSIPTSSQSWRHVPYLAKLSLTTASLEAEQTSLAYGLYVWPNPATSTINIYTSDRGPLRIVDVQGRRIWNGLPDFRGQLSIDAVTWPRGLYFVQQTAFGANGVFKLMLR